LVVFSRREGEFVRYKNTDAELTGMLNCGGGPAFGPDESVEQAQWRTDHQASASCITDHCPHKETIIDKIKEKSGVEVVEGTHPYKPDNIFA
jgi:predicted metal-binding protein